MRSTPTLGLAAPCGQASPGPRKRRSLPAATRRSVGSFCRTPASSTPPSVTKKWRSMWRLIRSSEVWMAAMTLGVSALPVTTSK